MLDNPCGLVLGSLGAALLILGGCQSPVASGTLPAQPQVVEFAGRYRGEYVILPGDKLEVVIQDHQDISRRVPVRPDGFISLPLLDDVKAAGLTFKELDQHLTRLYSKRLLKPELSVIATSVRPAQVYVLGKVARPAPVPLRNAQTAAQAIAQAGGFKDNSDPEAVSVIRITDQGRMRAFLVRTSLKGQPAALMALQNFPLHPNDVVFVPESGISQFNSWWRRFVSEPLTPINNALGIIVNYKIISALDTNN